MLSPAIRAKLRDPAYLERHLVAVAAIAKVGVLHSYDAVFLQWYAAAQQYLALVRPDRLDGFVAAFAPLCNLMTEDDKQRLMA